MSAVLATWETAIERHEQNSLGCIQQRLIRLLKHKHSIHHRNLTRYEDAGDDPTKTKHTARTSVSQEKRIKHEPQHHPKIDAERLTSDRKPE